MVFQSFPKPTRKIKVRKPIRKIGKIGKRNIDANIILFKEYSELTDLPPCEVGKVGLCWHMFMGFAHRHERVDYRAYPEMLSKVNQTLKSCNPCHGWIDSHREEREELFLKKRGPDELPRQ